MATESIAAPRLSQACQRLLECEGVPPADAAFVAGTLVDADLKGIHSHGVLRLPRYLRELAQGITNPRPKIATLGEGPAFARVDGDGALGPLVARYAMGVCMAKAQTAGSATVTACRSRHFGAAGTYASMALDADLIGIAMTVASPRLAPTGGSKPLYGNNPVSMAIPGSPDFPLLIDTAMGSTAAGRLELAAANGETIPAGLARSLDGTPTTDPNAALKGTIVPIGEHKGYGLALLIEVLAGLLGGAPYFGVERDEVSNHMRDKGIGHFFMVVDPARFMPIEAFKAATADMVRRTKESPRLAGVDEILLPGELEERRRRDRLVHGIPLAASTVEKLAGLARRRGFAL
ncbi:MAG: Ldh family oxidoreductase [Gemmatimonadota bacterium]